MTCVPSKSQQRTCPELGLCQAQFGRPHCVDCEPRQIRFAPGVIDGPCRREAQVDRALQEAANALQSAKDALCLVAAYLMGPHP